MLRDVTLSLIVFGLLPACFRRPFVGLMVFSWLAYMRAQDLTWGFARDMRWSYIVAIVTFAGFLLGKRRRFFLPDLRCYIMLAMLVLVGVGIFQSKNPDELQLRRYIEFSKIVGIALFTTVAVQSREHLRILIWTITLSLGFYGVKSGLWGVLTLASTPILRGPGGMLADNNDFSLALGMAVPMLLHVGFSERHAIVRRTFFLAVPLTAFTVLLTQSRGGFLALAMGLGVVMWRSRNRVAAFAVAGLIALSAVVVAPAKYTDRIASIADYKEDGAAQARLRAWGVATRMATDNPLFGVGLFKFRQHYLDYERDPTAAQLDGKGLFVAHNSYLQIWAEVGTPAFALYLTLILMSFITIWRVRALARRRYFSSWMLNYCTMFEASLVCFMVGSTFLNRAHFDLFYHYISIVLVFGHIARQELASEERYPVRQGGGRGEVKAAEARGFDRAGRRSGFRNTHGLVGGL